MRFFNFMHRRRPISYGRSTCIEVGGGAVGPILHASTIRLKFLRPIYINIKLIVRNAFRVCFDLISVAFNVE